MVTFGVKQAGYTFNTQTTSDVAATFQAIHDYVNGTVFTTETTDDMEGNPVRLGDYIDLPSLSVTGDGGGGSISGGNAVIAGHGTVLRLMVVGINSFNRRSSQPDGHTNTPHLVFQFQNLPGMHRMYASDTNEYGYMGSEMRTYIIDNFLTGLKASGVPEEYMWEVIRVITDGWSNVELVSDKLWLSTEREQHGEATYSRAEESAANQAYLEYYSAPVKRTKYVANGTAESYWNASAKKESDTNFCIVSQGGSRSSAIASKTANGIAPTFCIK
jgi:hypothetical protein